MAHISLMTMVYQAVDNLAAEGVGLDVQRSDFARQVALRLLKARWPVNLGRLPAATAAPTAEQRPIIENFLQQASFRRALMEAAALCSAVVRVLEEQLAVRSPHTSTRAFSEGVSVWSGRATVEGSIPDAAACLAYAQDLVDDHLARSQPLDVTRFAAAHGGRWRSQWDAVGAGNLATHRPSTLLLGSDVPPALVPRKEQRRPDDWSQGTDRSVFGRYRLHFKRTSEHEPRACVDPACRTPLRPAAADPAVAEVDRACQPWGLAHTSHHQVLRSVAAGLAGDPDARAARVSWVEWRTPCRPIDLSQDTDAEVSSAVAGALAAWKGNGLGHDLADSYGDLWGYQQIVETAVMRRAWMDLLGRERIFATPARRCWVPSTIAAGLNRAAPDAVHRWFRGEEIFDPEPTTRSQATVDLLGQHLDIAVDLLSGVPEARQAYLDTVDATGSGRRGYLAPADALALLEDLRKRGHA